jgi:branched-chain amino acid transport system permease protein
MGAVGRATEGLPLVPELFHPDRRLLWLGVLFVRRVYFFPAQIVSKLGARR